LIRPGLNRDTDDTTGGFMTTRHPSTTPGAIAERSGGTSGSGWITCSIRGTAFVEAACSDLPALRDAAVPAGAPALPPRFLRHCDEHTVVAVRSVLEAITSLPRTPSFEHCAVVAAPCQAGRINAARSLAQLRAGGAVTVSPHVVPQCSLHSLAGAVSVAFGMHGPHVGVGGGPDALAEGLFAALSLFQPHAAAGCDAAWLIATEWDDEPVLDSAGVPVGDPVCRSLALLLGPAASLASGERTLALSLHLPASGKHHGVDSLSDLVAFARAVDMCVHGSALASWTVPCPWGAQIRVTAPQPEWHRAVTSPRRRGPARASVRLREAA
jgi:hypothetical protein